MMKLSLALGVAYHEIREWSAAELTLYRAYYQIQPFGEDAENHRHALQRHTMVNINRKPNTPPHPLRDFHPFPQPKADHGVGEVRASFRSMAKTGLIKRNS